ncbi:MAG: DUF5086 family protein [Thiobacillus sp.]|nr:DUF5086 family protein [Thiobacillus sp.]
MYPISILLLALAVTLAGSAVAADNRIASHDRGIWSIPGKAGAKRWIVIHNLAEARASGIYHIEVLQRTKGAPAWQVERLARHMAITEMALERSVVEPLAGGAVYPEPFDDAFRRWQAENDGRGGKVCAATVSACLE